MPVSIRSIHHVQVEAPASIGVETIAGAARAFYGALLGLAEVPKPAELAARGGCWFSVGEQELHVGVTKDFAPAAKAHPAFVVADAMSLHELARRLELAGYPISWPPAEELPGKARFFSRDPWGNRLEFLA